MHPSRGPTRRARPPCEPGALPLRCNPAPLAPPPSPTLPLAPPRRRPCPPLAHAPPPPLPREGGAEEGFVGLQDLQQAQQQPSTAASDTASEHSLPDDDTREPMPGSEHAAPDAAPEAAPTKEEPAYP